MCVSVSVSVIVDVRMRVCVSVSVSVSVSVCECECECECDCESPHTHICTHNNRQGKPALTLTMHAQELARLLHRSLAVLCCSCESKLALHTPVAGNPETFLVGYVLREHQKVKQISSD